jgi:hypothetical protein
MAALREPSLSGAVAAQDEASAPPPVAQILSSRPASPPCGAPFFRTSDRATPLAAALETAPCFIVRDGATPSVKIFRTDG